MRLWAERSFVATLVEGQCSWSTCRRINSGAGGGDGSANDDPDSIGYGLSEGLIDSGPDCSHDRAFRGARMGAAAFVPRRVDVSIPLQRRKLQMQALNAALLASAVR